MLTAPLPKADFTAGIMAEEHMPMSAAHQAIMRASMLKTTDVYVTCAPVGASHSTGAYGVGEIPHLGLSYLHPNRSLRLYTEPEPGAWIPVGRLVASLIRAACDRWQQQDCTLPLGPMVQLAGAAQHGGRQLREGLHSAV